VPFEVVAARVFDPARPADTSPPFYGTCAVVVDGRGVGTVVVLPVESDDGYQLVSVCVHKGGTTGRDRVER
jgi:hypothetical protein